MYNFIASFFQIFTNECSAGGDIESRLIIHLHIHEEHCKNLGFLSIFRFIKKPSELLGHNRQDFLVIQQYRKEELYIQTMGIGAF
jgi:hypothetical protein